LVAILRFLLVALLRLLLRQPVVEHLPPLSRRRRRKRRRRRRLVPLLCMSWNENQTLRSQEESDDDMGFGLFD
jgi:hypothetical protein